jgi:hypothetical protein
MVVALNAMSHLVLFESVAGTVVPVVRLKYIEKPPLSAALLLISFTVCDSRGAGDESLSFLQELTVTTTRAAIQMLIFLIIIVY